MFRPKSSSLTGWRIFLAGSRMPLHPGCLAGVDLGARAVEVIAAADAPPHGNDTGVGRLKLPPIAIAEPAAPGCDLVLSYAATMPNDAAFGSHILSL